MNLIEERKDSIAEIKLLNRFYSIATYHFSDTVFYLCITTLEILKSVFQCIFPTLCHLHCAPIWGYVIGNQQCMWHARENVSDGAVLQKTE